MTKHNTNPAHRRPGFSLIEILIVISVITILVALTLVGADKMRDAARQSQASISLGALLNAAEEYKVVTGSYFDPLAPESDTVEPSGGEFKFTTGAKFVNRANSLPSVNKVLLSAGADVLQDFIDNHGNESPDGYKDLKDPWGNPIVYAAYADHGDSNTEDDFLPQRGSAPKYENGRPSGGVMRPFFASSGPDGDFGHAKDDPTGEALKDNIYSFEIE